MLTPASPATRSMKGGRLLVQDDQPCLACGYNLRGLPIGGSCPECGAVMILAGRGLDDPLNQMPTNILKAFLRGGIAGTAALAGVIGLVAGVFLGWIADVQALWIVALVVASVWCLAVWWLTPAFNHPAAQHHGFVAGSKRRLLARVLQFGWILFSLTLLIDSMIVNQPTVAETAFSVIALLSLATGLFGLMILSMVLEGLAEWVRESSALTAMNLMFWGPLMLCGGIAISWVLGIAAPNGLLSGLFSMFLLLIAAIGGLMIVIGFTWGMTVLIRGIALSMVHAIEHRNRTMRIAERRQQFAETILGRIDGIDEQERD